MGHISGLWMQGFEWKWCSDGTDFETWNVFDYQGGNLALL
jgi:hypothetical protein